MLFFGLLMSSTLPSAALRTMLPPRFVSVLPRGPGWPRNVCDCTPRGGAPGIGPIVARCSGWLAAPGRMALTPPALPTLGVSDPPPAFRELCFSGALVCACGCVLPFGNSPCSPGSPPAPALPLVLLAFAALLSLRWKMLLKRCFTPVPLALAFGVVAVPPLGVLLAL